MYFGETLSTFRNEKNMTQDEVANGIMARPYLSLLEHEKYTPTYPKFIQLLNRLNVSYDEFIYRLNDNQIPFERRIFIELSIAANSSDSRHLKEIKEQAKKNYDETGHLMYYHLYLLSTAIQKLYLNNNHISDEIIETIKPIKNYLLNINNWNLYEIKLFNNALFGFNKEDAAFFASNCLKSIKKYEGFTDFQNLKQHLLFNLSTLFIDNHDYILGKKYAQASLAISHSHFLLYEKILSSFNLYLCQIKLNEQREKSLHKIQVHLETLRNLEFANTASNLQVILKEHGISLKA